MTVAFFLPFPPSSRQSTIGRRRFPFFPSPSLFPPFFFRIEERRAFPPSHSFPGKIGHRSCGLFFFSSFSFSSKNEKLKFRNTLRPSLLCILLFFLNDHPPLRGGFFFFLLLLKIVELLLRGQLLLFFLFLFPFAFLWCIAEVSPSPSPPPSSSVRKWNRACS